MIKNVGQYKIELDQLKSESFQNLVALADWVDIEALPWLWSEFLAFAKKIEVVLATEPRERLAHSPCPGIADQALPAMPVLCV